MTGSVGSGKTSTAADAAEVLESREIPHALLDIDDLSAFWPAPPGDPFRFRLMLANLAAVWCNFRDAGAGRLLLSGVVESRAELTAYREALGGAELTVCRLVAPVETLRERIRSRGRDSGPSLDWHLHRAGELTAIQNAARVEDFAVDNGSLPRRQVAEEILTKAGWT